MYLTSIVKLLWVTQHGRENYFCLHCHDQFPSHLDEAGFWSLLCCFQTNAGVRNSYSILIQCTKCLLPFGKLC